MLAAKTATSPTYNTREARCGNSAPAWGSDGNGQLELWHTLPGILAAIATFSVSSLLMFAFGAPIYFIVIPTVLSVLVGRRAQRQDSLDR